MRCRRCGKDLGSDSVCNFCGYQNAEEVHVREMSAVERNNYNGITLEARPHDHYQHYQRGGWQSNFQQSARINLNRTGFWTQLFGNHIVTRILVALVLVLLIAFTLFVALPFALTIVGFIIVYCLIRRLILRR